MHRPLPQTNPTLHYLTLPAITITIRGGREDLNPGWPLDQILEIEHRQARQIKRIERKKGM